MPPNTETLIPQLIANYAETRRTDLSLPDSTALPFVISPAADEKAFPQVVFATADTKSPHPKRLNLTVAVELQTGTDTQTDIPEENSWAAGLRYILADAAGFQTWLQAQDAETRTGYRITKYMIAPDPTGMGIDDKLKKRGRMTTLLVNVRTDELAPVQ